MVKHSTQRLAVVVAEYVFTDTDSYEEPELEGRPLGLLLTVALFHVSFLIHDDNLLLFFTFIFPAIHVTTYNIFTKQTPFKTTVMNAITKGSTATYANQAY